MSKCKYSPLYPCTAVRDCEENECYVFMYVCI